MNFISIIPFLFVDFVILAVLLSKRNDNKTAAYFSITRILVIALILQSIYQYVVLGSADGSGDTLFGIVLPAVYIIICLPTAWLAYKSNLHRKLSLAVIAVGCLGLVATAILATSLTPIKAGTRPGLIPSVGGERVDNQTAYDFYLLGQDVTNYAQKNQRLPGSLTDAINQPNSYGSRYGIDGRIASYKYTPLPAAKASLPSALPFELCANFSADKSAAGGNRSQPNASNHHKGWNCFTYNQQD